jgi:hypothetical protein
MLKTKESVNFGIHDAVCVLREILVVVCWRNKNVLRKSQTWKETRFSNGTLVGFGHNRQPAG